MTLTAQAQLPDWPLSSSLFLIRRTLQERKALLP
jgi:hypothetical protein